MAHRWHWWPSAERGHDRGNTCPSSRLVSQQSSEPNPELSQRPRWLVFNKADLLEPKEREKLAKALVRRLKWKAPWFVVSAIAKEGTWPVCLKIQDFFDQRKAEAVEEMRSLDA